MKIAAPVLLSVNAGYLDTAGFLALQGLFTAHVTGNFVTIGAALVFGTSGVVAKLLALPVFCATVFAIRWFADAVPRRDSRGPAWSISVELGILTLGCGLAIVFGPFRNSDSGWALATGMTLVCGLAVQNALQRVHLSQYPPTTMMTGNTTQFMMDLADLARGSLAPAERQATLARLARLAEGVVGFCLRLRGGGGAVLLCRRLVFRCAAAVGPCGARAA